MKSLNSLFLLLLLAGTTGIAQTLEFNTTDAETGDRYILTRNHPGGRLELEHSVAKSGGLFFSAGYQSAKSGDKTTETYFIDLYIVHNDNRLGCLKEFVSSATLYLADDTKIECFQISETDCDKVAFQAAFALKQRGNWKDSMEENFKKLMTTEIVEIRVKTTEKTEVYKIKPKDKENLKNHFILVDKAMKAKANNP